MSYPVLSNVPILFQMFRPGLQLKQKLEQKVSYQKSNVLYETFRFLKYAVNIIHFLDLLKLNFYYHGTEQKDRVQMGIRF